MDNINIGLTLMAVGMVTVFAILLIIINLNKVLIKLVNSFAPEESPKQTLLQPVGIDPHTKEIIDAAVKQITGGKGRVQSISKL